MTNKPTETSASVATGGRTHGRAAFAFIFVTVLLDMIALGVIVPVLPKLIIGFEHGDMSMAATQTGVFAFVWAAMQFVFAPVTGALADRYGRRPVVLLSNFGLGCDYILMAVAPTLGWLFAGRVISGIAAAAFRRLTPTSPTSRRRNSAPRCSAKSASHSAPAERNPPRSTASTCPPPRPFDRR